MLGMFIHLEQPRELLENPQPSQASQASQPSPQRITLRFVWSRSYELSFIYTGVLNSVELVIFYTQPPGSANMNLPIFQKWSAGFVCLVGDCFDGFGSRCKHHHSSPPCRNIFVQSPLANLRCVLIVFSKKESSRQRLVERKSTKWSWVI